MEMLNQYLRSLLSSCGDELRLEPDKKPYINSDNKATDIGNIPLMGTQISTMVFPLIPAEVKSALPNQNEVDFEHPNELGNFNFKIQKSPAGFIVTIRPVINASSSRLSPPLPDAAPDYASLAEAPAANFELESSSMGYDAAKQVSAPGLVFEPPDMAMEYVPSAFDTPQQPEVLPANDPQFQTVFSPTATYEPSGDRDLELGEFSPPPELSSGVELENFAPEEFDRMGVPDFTTLPPPPPPPISVAPVASPQTFGSQADFSPAPANAAMTAKMDALFHAMAEVNASDLHLSVSMPPLVRKDGKIKPLRDGEPAISADMMRDMLRSIMPPSNQEEFARRHDTDFAYEITGLARFRCNVFMDRKGMGGVFRIIPAKMTTAEQLGLSQAILGLCDLSKGLVVVTGPTGSGKSTTLCGMVNYINTRREDHIITIEDPIEFVHDNYKCLVNQREVHNHTESFKDALRAALREDPDILLVGEMRDLETISIAIETAETGHLVFGTLHTTTAASTVDRIIDQFPADRQQQIRVMLSESLKGVIAQTLLPKKGGGRVPALEVLIVTPAISNLIREGKTFQIPSAMQTGRTHGMVMLNDSLFEHVKNGTVEPLDAYIKAVDKPGFEAMLTRGGFKL